jgi:hypothetical protein
MNGKLIYTPYPLNGITGAIAVNSIPGPFGRLCCVVVLHQSFQGTSEWAAGNAVIAMT